MKTADILTATFLILVVVLTYSFITDTSDNPNIPDVVVIPDNPEPKPLVINAPKFTNYPELRTVSVEKLGVPLADIDSHMPAGHIYKDSDPITWGHETTHGINSQIRMKFARTVSSGPNGKETVSYAGDFIANEMGHELFVSRVPINGFYVLEDRAVIINEPEGTLTDAARMTPKSLRGKVYKLYMIEQAKYWDERPLYILDELTSYSNGAEIRLDRDITSRAETVSYMLEFIGYTLAMAQATQYEDQQFIDYLRWSFVRSMKLYENNKEKYGTVEYQEQYLDTLRASNDAEDLREYTRNLLGHDYTHEILGF